jgi:hypothetical protein
MKKIVVLLIVIMALCPIFSVNLYAEETYSVIWLSEDYRWVRPFSEGLAPVSKVISNKTKSGYIDKTGKEVIPAVYDEVGYFSEGMASVYKDKKYAFIDKTGTMIIPFRYDSVVEFHAGVARVMKDGKFGFVDKTGKEIVPCVYDYADERMMGGFATVGKGISMTKYGYVNKEGKEVVPLIYDGAWGGFNEGLALVQKNGKCGFVNTSGKVVIPLLYRGAGRFVDGITYVENNNKYGVIDKTGKLVVPMQYSNIEDFSNGLAKVIISIKDNKYGYINKAGKIVINMNGASFHEGFAFVGKGEHQYGYIDTTGKVVVPLKYDSIWANEFHNGFAVVGKDFGPERKFGYVDKNGKEIVPLVYDSAEAFQDGFAMVGKLNPEYRQSLLGYIDKTGQEVIPHLFNYAYDFSDGVAIARKFETWGIISIPNPGNVESIVSAKPTSSKVLVNGRDIAFEAYGIGESNYFMLRDIAMVLNSSEKQFDVAWDGSKNAISLVTGKEYTPVGGELNISEKAIIKDARLAAAKVYIDGKEVKLDAYTINGNNYFKLRDLGKVLNFGVEWNAITNSIVIDSTSEYKEL